MNGLKRTEPDVQRQFTGFDSSSANSRDGFFRKMQTRSGRGNCSRSRCEERLVTLAVRAFVLAIDIRRQGDVSQTFHVFLRRFASTSHEPQGSDAQFATGENFGFKFSRAENNSFAHR